jgi:hypothetical protein
MLKMRVCIYVWVYACMPECMHMHMVSVVTTAINLPQVIQNLKKDNVCMYVHVYIPEQHICSVARARTYEGLIMVIP